MTSHGMLKLPPGFRFHPTDEELVIQYLRRRALSIPLPAAIISDIDICKYDPWDLPGDGENAKYFFTRKETKYPNGKRSNRSCASGYWKATGKDRAIHASRSNLVVGMKKSLVFYRGKSPKGDKTEWVMHEYMLSDFGLQPHMSLQMKNSIQIPTEDWVLCRIFLKKTAQRKHTMIKYLESSRSAPRPRSPARPILIDFMMDNQRDSETSSASSSITEVSEACDSGDSISSSKRA